MHAMTRATGNVEAATMEKKEKRRRREGEEKFFKVSIGRFVVGCARLA
jgi:hypothetical protein